MIGVLAHLGRDADAATFAVRARHVQCGLYACLLGDPKGVVLTHGAISAGCSVLFKYHEVRPSGRGCVHELTYRAATNPVVLRLTVIATLGNPLGALAARLSAET